MSKGDSRAAVLETLRRCHIATHLLPFVQFKERYRIAYNVDVQAETSCHDQTTGIDHPIRVDVSGDENGQNVQFRDSGSPALNNTAIVQCLFTEEIALPTFIPQIDTFRLAAKYSDLSKTTVPMITVGWKIATDVRMEYDTSVIDSNDQKVELDYKLNRVTTLRGLWGRNAQVPMGDLGADLRLRWEY